MKRALRLTAVGIATVPLAVVMVVSAVVVATAIIGQLLAGLIDLSQASFASFLNPAYLIALQSLGGTGGIADALVGGPGAPGGTVGRFAIYAVFALLGTGAYLTLRNLWSWATQQAEATTSTGGTRMKTITAALAIVTLAFTAACGGTANTATDVTSTTSSRTDQKESTPEPAAATVEEPNLADGFNQAWVALVAAQQAYDALGATDNVNEAAVTTEWINQVGTRLKEVRAAWQKMKTEADQLPLPQTFTTKGEMSRGTVDEYMGAYDDYITLQEDSYARTQQCIANGGENFGCTFKEGIALVSEPEYVAAWERLREATYAVFDEAEQRAP